MTLDQDYDENLYDALFRRVLDRAFLLSYWNRRWMRIPHPTASVIWCVALADEMTAIRVILLRQELERIYDPVRFLESDPQLLHLGASIAARLN